MSKLEIILTFLSALLAVLLALSRSKIKLISQELEKLIKTLDEERKKRIFPLLELRLDEDNYAFFLENVGDIPAYNITFDQVPVTLESGVERTFGFQFGPVESLEPHTETKLNYELYHDNKKEPDHFKRSLFTHVTFSKIQFKLNYQNIHHTKFKMRVQKTRTHFQLIEASPL